MMLSKGLSFHRLPWVTALVTLAAAVVQLDPQLGDRLALVPADLGKGEIWRLLTGPITHFNRAHALGDIAAFAVWSTAVELRCRRLLVRALLMSGLGVSCLICLAYPSLGQYRGLSAVDCALAATLMAIGFDEPRLRRNPSLLAALVVCAAGLVAKTVFELVQGHAILAPDLGHRVGLLPGAHAFGIAAGLVAFTTWRATGNPFRISRDRQCTPACTQSEACPP